MAKRAIRPIRIEGNVAYVPLTQGYEAIIDAADVPLVEGWNWLAAVSRRKDGSIISVYAGRNRELRRRRVGRRVHLHRVILGVDGIDTDEAVDHINGNGLDNRRANLRRANRSQNMHNQSVRRNNASGVKGVSFIPSSGFWRARIMVERTRYKIGVFKTKEEAAAAYQEAAKRLVGQFVRA